MLKWTESRPCSGVFISEFSRRFHQKYTQNIWNWKWKDDWPTGEELINNFINIFTVSSKSTKHLDLKEPGRSIYRKDDKYFASSSQKNTPELQGITDLLVDFPASWNRRVSETSWNFSKKQNAFSLGAAKVQAFHSWRRSIFGQTFSRLTTWKPCWFAVPKVVNFTYYRS